VAEAAAVRSPDDDPTASARAETPESAAGLSPREVEVLRRLVAGASNREIAEELFISPRTVQTHMTNIFGKLGVNTRAAAVGYAYQHKLV
jgi:DNA-binding CsgD family transcriptional regulator